MKIILTKQEILEAFNFKEPCEIEIADSETKDISLAQYAPALTKDNKSFFEKFFGLTIQNPTEAKDGYISLVIPKELTCEQIYKAMQTQFSCWKYCGDIDKTIKEQQLRPDTYYITFKDSVEPDSEHLGRSYDDFCGDGKNYMTPKEGMLAYLYYFYKTGNMMDVKGVTRFHALDSDGNAMCMYGRNDGQFSVDGSDRDYRDSDFGPREVSINLIN